MSATHARPDFSGVWSLNISRSTLRVEIPKKIESLLKVADRELHFRDHWSLSGDKKILTMAHPDDDLAGQISILESVSSQDVGEFRSSVASD